MNRLVLIAGVFVLVLILAFFLLPRSDVPTDDVLIDEQVLSDANDALLVLYHEYDFAFEPNYELVTDEEVDADLCVAVNGSICLEGVERRQLTASRDGSPVVVGFVYATPERIESFFRAFDEAFNRTDVAMHLDDSPVRITRRAGPESVDVFRYVRANTTGAPLQVFEGDELVSHTVLMHHTGTGPVLFYVTEEAPYFIERQLTYFGQNASRHDVVIERANLTLA